MIATSDSVLRRRTLRLCLGVLALALPACGISAYEARMRETQARADIFLEEQQYLGLPVEAPTRKVQSDQDKEAREEPVANVFFRPPMGIEIKPQAENSFLWSYAAGSNKSFSRVELALSSDSKNFATQVLNYHDSAQPSGPQRHPSLPFDTYEGSDAQFGYSINFLNSENARTKAAVIYVFPKGLRDKVRTIIDVSLRTLAVDGQAGEARRRYERKSPWRLRGKISP